MRLLLLIFLLIPAPIIAEDNLIALEHVSINLKDRASILRGAKTFAGTCMVCHTAKYLAHDALAQSEGITLEKMPLNHKEWIYNVVPPDLSLIARIRGANWLYTYFHSFYKDPARPTGFNNLLVPNSMMTNIFASLQGVQQLANPNDIKSFYDHRSLHYYQALQLIQTGSMTPEEFDDTTRDIVNFLVYARDPHAQQRKNLGIYVLSFLAVFFIVAYLLKKVVWKDVE